MKKIAYFLVCILLMACNVDSVESDLIPTNGQNVTPPDPECVIDVNDPPAVMGSVWTRTSFVIETPIDGNNDGIFSTELEGEYNCSSVLNFRTDFKVSNPIYENSMFDVINDGNGNLSQLITCGIIDGLFPVYTQDGNTVNLCFDGEFLFSGTLSNNNQTLTFNFTNSDYFFGTNEILLADGTVETYQGGAVITYTRQ